MHLVVSGAVRHIYIYIYIYRRQRVDSQCHAAYLPFSDSVVSFAKVRVAAGNIRIASPTFQRIGVLLITTFVELSVVAGRSRTRAGRPHVVSWRPMLIHTYHTMSMPRPYHAVPWPWEVAFRRAWSWHGRVLGMTCGNETWLHCVNQMEKTQYKPLAGRHGRGTAWYMCMWISLYVRFTLLSPVCVPSPFHLRSVRTVCVRTVRHVQSRSRTAHGRGPASFPSNMQPHSFSESTSAATALMLDVEKLAAPSYGKKSLWVHICFWSRKSELDIWVFFEKSVVKKNPSFIKIWQEIAGMISGLRGEVAENCASMGY
jgi:hypothetical protein